MVRRAAARRWRRGALRLRTRRQALHARRLGRLLPPLMEEFHARRDPLEVLDCADAVLAYYELKAPLSPSLALVRRRTERCLLSGTCERGR